MRDEKYNLPRNPVKKSQSPVEASAEYLKEHNIPFSTSPDGKRIFVDFNDGLISFWPTSGLWLIQNTCKRGSGVESLAKQVLGKLFISPKSPSST